MLAELSIRDIVLIEALTIRFDDGLSVLTGETGAGKSILLDSLALALGARGDAGLVRQGVNQGQVTAIFELPAVHPLRTEIQEAGIQIDTGEPLIFRRVQSSDGRTRAFINDQSVSAGLLQKIGKHLVEIHGQHDDRALVETDTHRDLLDAFGQLSVEAAHVATLYRDWRGAAKALLTHKARVAEAAKEADYLKASSEELEALAPEEGEETELAEKRQGMMQAEKIAADLNDAHEILSGPKSPVPDIASLLRRLERKTEEAPGLLEEANENLGRALDHLAEAQTLIEKAINISDFDNRVLEQTEERLFALRAASRKFNVPVENLAELAVQMADQLAELDAGEARLMELEKAEAEALAVYDRAALQLSESRKAAADQLVAAVMAELPALKLEKAAFIINQTSDADNRSETGIDTIEFWVQTNPGTRPGPMMKVASGGELSRFLLALKVALADRGSAPTLVFDEIDTGVGGAVADAIGSRLSRLSSKVQVLSVTHAPQVAARAGHHFLISKKTKDADKLATSIVEIDMDKRREELARMLSGATVTDEARAAAAQLLNAG
ncbi:DNA repair protein RecN [Ahrensia marina]|uniref:DNA repair protein RecN n=1 Tax=Ahrensia marina TaxID=1514904 RepID=A0A0N0VM81_9HYPH|nr:DNA repair protein RecN [Ahrensia marina]KPB02861.1 DNA recombination protein RecN [Ahrensia marina]